MGYGASFRGEGGGEIVSARGKGLSKLIGLGLLGLVAGCGSSSPPATSGASSGTTSGASTGATAGTSGTASGATSGTMSGATTGATSGTADSGPDSTMSSGGVAEASTEAEASGPTGDAGEPCNPDSSCATGLVCSVGICVPAGAAGQPCTAALTCNAGLQCVGTTCQATGDAGQPCILPSGTCDPGLGLYCDSTTMMCLVSSCSGKPQKALPYNLSADFNTVTTSGPGAPNFEVLTDNSISCDATTFPPLPNTGLGPVPEAGADAEAGPPMFPVLVDAGVQSVTYATPPPCYQFAYDPNSLNVGSQYGVAIFTSSGSPADAEASTSAGSGVCIAPGATMITFWARASVNGTIVKFGSTRAGQCLVGYPGAIANDPVAQQQACGRTFPATLGAVEFFLALTTQWAQYVVSLPPGEPYTDVPGGAGGVSNGFSVVVEPEQVPMGAYIFVKDIVWTNAPWSSFSGGDAGRDAATDGPSE
jgi:hypothetical protein